MRTMSNLERDVRASSIPSAMASGMEMKQNSIVSPRPVRK